MTFKLKKDERYIFATDLDGTLLHPLNHSLHIDSFEAIEKIKENGHHFVITTGRSWWWTKSIYEQLGSIDASVHFSGAVVHHPHSEDFDEYRNGISQVVLKNLVNKINMWDYIAAVQAVGRKYHATWNHGDDLNKLFFNPYEYIMIIDTRKQDVEEFEKIVEDIIGDGYFMRTWKGFGEDNYVGLTISPQGTNKSDGLKRIAKYYDVPRENVIYFGDNVNDLDALEWAGYSFAPSNGTKDAKASADEVMKLSCMEGAVPKKIIELINEQNENN